MATCNETACEFHGLCHCGCKGVPGICLANVEARRYVYGMPREYVLGHAPASAEALDRGRFAARELRRRGFVAVGLVRPDVVMLCRTYGVNKAARLIGVAPSTVDRWLHGSRRRDEGRLGRGYVMSFENATRVRNALLARESKERIYRPNTKLTEPRVSVFPLLAFMRRKNISAKSLGKNRERMIYSWKSNKQLLESMADEVASEWLGVHPTEIWGAEWERVA